jgi:hypothetical protein
MTHFARLDANNTVIAVYPGRPEDDGKETELSARTGDTYRQTSYTGRIRKHFAGVGFTYDATLDAFIPPKPYPSWVINETTCLWEPPVPYPTDGQDYDWNEETQSWVARPTL